MITRDAVPTITPAPGTFARSVLEHRHPVIVEQVRAAHPYGPEQQARLDALLADLLDAPLEPPALSNGDGDQRWPDAPAWQAWLGPYRGLSSVEVPFLVAESWFYRRLLDAVAFVEPGPWRGVDPFAPMKAAELRALEAVPSDADRDALLLACVWGNQADLGFQLVGGEAARRRGSLVADDTAAFWGLLDGGGRRLAWVCDNAGRELVADLLLVDRLLADGLAGSVTLHLKPAPYFVSDATARDLADCVGAVPGAVRDRLVRFAAGDRLGVAADAFWCAPLELRSAPAHLAAQLAAADLVVVKGDLTYRRLVGDAAWPPSTPFADAVQLPVPVAALRTLKSDVVVGLEPAVVARLEAGSPGWRTDGSEALVQVKG